MSKTSIQWTDYSWNPIIGCKHISPGCDNCYAEKMANRIAHMDSGAGVRYREVVCWDTDGKWDGTTYFNAESLDEPLEWFRPRKVFVGSMTDIFYHARTNKGREELFELWKIMEKTPHITYQILTKRPLPAQIFIQNLCKILPNVWLGITVCNQEEANKKIPILLDTPAAKRFVSIEPMLGMIDLEWLPDKNWIMNALGGVSTYPTGRIIHNKLDWVIVGGETGPGARPLNPDWIVSLYDQVAKYDIPFFFKSWGSKYDKKAVQKLSRFQKIKEFPHV